MIDVQLPLVVLGVTLAAAVVGRVVDDSEDKSRHWSPEAARDAYVEGEIGIGELERRLDRTLDTRSREIRDRVEGVSHVGPYRAARIADQFDTVAEIREAERSDLEDIHGVGPSIAERIQERV